MQYTKSSGKSLKIQVETWRSWDLHEPQGRLQKEKYVNYQLLELL